MRTIGKRWPSGLPYGTALCFYCGVKWPLAKLIKDRSGYLTCPDDVGPDRVPYARGRHIRNDEGTGSSIAPSDIVDPIPVLL